MKALDLLALQAWSAVSNEGILVFDTVGTICLANARIREQLGVDAIPETVEDLIRRLDTSLPALQSALTLPSSDGPRWGQIISPATTARRMTWQCIPIIEEGVVLGACTIFRNAMPEGRMDVAQQSFLSMISHDLRTPLSTILGFAELLYNNVGTLSGDEQLEFLEHIIKNANDLSRYTQIALDVMYLEAGMQSFETEPVYLKGFVHHWLKDAAHRYPMHQVGFQNGAVNDEPLVRASPAALHRILHILLEFALAETPDDASVNIRLGYNEKQAHVIIQHNAPALSSDDATALFCLMHPRDLSEESRPPLHRMQLYVACLLAERQQGFLTLNHRDNQIYELDLVMPLV